MNVHQYLIIQSLASHLRTNELSSAYVDFNAEAGEARPRVTYAAAKQDLGFAREVPRVSGSELSEVLATFAENFLDRRLPGWKEGAGSKAQVIFDATGALLLDVTPRNGCSVQTRISEVVDFSETRKEALQTSRTSLLSTIALKDDKRLSRLLDHKVMEEATRFLAADITPGDDRLKAVAHLLWNALPGVAKSSLPVAMISKRIEERLFADLTVRQAPWFSSSIFDQPAIPEEKPEGLGKAPLWLQLNALEAERLFKAIEASPDPILREIRAKMEICLSNVGSDPAFRDAVIGKYASRLTDGDVDFQPDGLVSKSDEGAYVMAFLWVSNADAGLEDPDADLDDLDNTTDDEEMEP